MCDFFLWRKEMRGREKDKRGEKERREGEKKEE
jgi:hypothetical protein